MHTFWELLRESVIVQGIVTSALVLTLCYLAITQVPIPDLLRDATILVLGFWFGSKSVYTRNRSEQA